MHSLHMILACLAAAGAGAAAATPYLIPEPGIVFEWLPRELEVPVEGILTEESGAVSSGPAASGTEYHIHYWREDVPQGAGRSEWLETRLAAMLPPDAPGTWRLGDIQWVEGSRLAGCSSSLSMGLMPFLNFNLVAENGAVLGRGRAYAAFRRGYSVLIYCLAPEEHSLDAVTSLEGMVHMMHLAEEQE
ncbi:hypothetical protein GX411_08685 [Candidatus Fermentibacteria bacterium]|nr:hypothetical protein [Candidatus Fermentibacteria bacterium]